MSKRADGLNDIYEHNVTVRETLTAKEINANKIKASGLTSGSVTFVDVNKYLAEDNSNLFWDDTNKRLGIGTATPEELLHVMGKIRVGDATDYPTPEIILDKGSASSGKIKFVRSSTTDWEFDHNAAEGLDIQGFKSGENLSVITNAGDIIFNDGAEIMRIQASTNNVGIGTASPEASLDIRRDATAGGEDDSNIKLKAISDTTMMTLGTDNTLGIVYIQGAEDGVSWANRPLVLQKNGGNVGIGTASPDTILHLKGATDIPLKVESTDTGSAIQFTDSVGTSYITHNTNYFKIQPGGTEVMRLLSTGNVGIGTATPTTIFSVNEKCGNTSIGGICIKLTNKTGANTVQGQLVSPDTASDDGVILNAIGGVNPIGVFLESGIAANAEAWVVISGIADVALDDNVASVHGNWMGSGVAAGYASTGASPPAAPTHFEEIGHCIETVAAGGGGTHILARCVLHFN